MSGKAIVYITVLTTLLLACSSPKVPQDFLTIALSSQHPGIKKVMDSVAQYELQIKYTQINRDHDSIAFTEYNYQVNDSNYFYPASTVKLLTAILSLEKLNELDSVDLYTRFYIECDSLETTFAHEISKIFAVITRYSKHLNREIQTSKLFCCSQQLLALFHVPSFCPAIIFSVALAGILRYIS